MGQSRGDFMNSSPHGGQGAGMITGVEQKDPEYLWNKLRQGQIWI